MRELGEHLHAGGHTVAGIRVAGHGTSVADLARTSWRDWLASAREGLSELRRHCDSTVVIGLSMGTLLALALAEEQPEHVGGLALLSTALFSNHRLERYLPLLRAGAILGPALPRPWRTVRKGERDIADPVARAASPTYDAIPLRSLVDLVRLQRHARERVSAIRQPVLAIHARHDHTCPLDNVDFLQRRLPVPPQVTVLERSYHVITVDHEKQQVAQAVLRFVTRAADGGDAVPGDSISTPDAEAAGLCAHCRHVRWVRAARSTFALCRRAETDPRFPRYPRLPVHDCPGYELGPGQGERRRSWP